MEKLVLAAKKSEIKVTSTVVVPFESQLDSVIHNNGAAVSRGASFVAACFALHTSASVMFHN
jgi:hypothetical protein